MVVAGLCVETAIRKSLSSVDLRLGIWVFDDLFDHFGRSRKSERKGGVVFRVRARLGVEIRQVFEFGTTEASGVKEYVSSSMASNKSKRPCRWHS